MTEQFTIEIDGREYDCEYVTHDCLSSGDYGGYGYYGAINIECVEKDHPENCSGGGMGYRGLEQAVESDAFVTDGKLVLPHVVTLHGGYNSQQCYILAGDYADEIIGALDDYPLLDESAVSNYECEQLDEQLPSLMHDVFNAVESLVEDIDDDDVYERVNAVIQDHDFSDTLDERLRAVNHGDLPIGMEGEYQPYWYVTDIDDHAQAIVDAITLETDLSPYGVAMRIRNENRMNDMFAA